jgi:hypothetical protein
VNPMVSCLGELSKLSDGGLSLRPEQCSHIAAAYDSAAFNISFPAQTRAAFAKKADWFRLVARVGEKRAALNANQAKQAQEPQPNPFGFIAAMHTGISPA